MSFIHIPATLPDGPMDLDGFRGLDLLADTADALGAIGLRLVPVFQAGQGWPAFTYQCDPADS